MTPIGSERDSYVQMRDGPNKAVIRAQITGDDQASAEGISVANGFPIRALCRRLLEAGFDPRRPLEAYRGEMLCLTVRSLAAGAALALSEGKVSAGKAPRTGHKSLRSSIPPLAGSELAEASSGRSSELFELEEQRAKVGRELERLAGERSDPPEIFAADQLWLPSTERVLRSWQGKIDREIEALSKPQDT